MGHFNLTAYQFKKSLESVLVHYREWDFWVLEFLRREGVLPEAVWSHFGSEVVFTEDGKFMTVTGKIVSPGEDDKVTIADGISPNWGQVLADYGRILRFDQYDRFVPKYNEPQFHIEWNEFITHKPGGAWVEIFGQENKVWRENNAAMLRHRWAHFQRLPLFKLFKKARGNPFEKTKRVWSKDKKTCEKKRAFKPWQTMVREACQNLVWKDEDETGPAGFVLKKGEGPYFGASQVEEALVYLSRVKVLPDFVNSSLQHGPAGLQICLRKDKRTQGFSRWLSIPGVDIAMWAPQRAGWWCPSDKLEEVGNKSTEEEISQVVGKDLGKFLWLQRKKVI